MDHLLKGSVLDSPLENRHIQVEYFLNVSKELSNSPSRFAAGYFHLRAPVAAVLDLRTGFVNAALPGS